MAETKSTATQVGRDAADKVRESDGDERVRQEGEGRRLHDRRPRGHGRAARDGGDEAGCPAAPAATTPRVRSTSTRCASKTKDATRRGAPPASRKVDEVVGGAIARHRGGVRADRGAAPRLGEGDRQKGARSRARACTPRSHVQRRRRASSSRSRRASARRTPTRTPPRGTGLGAAGATPHVVDDPVLGPGRRSSAVPLRRVATPRRRRRGASSRGRSRGASRSPREVATGPLAARGCRADGASEGSSTNLASG